MYLKTVKLSLLLCISGAFVGSGLDGHTDTMKCYWLYVGKCTDAVCALYSFIVANVIYSWSNIYNISVLH